MSLFTQLQNFQTMVPCFFEAILGWFSHLLFYSVNCHFSNTLNRLFFLALNSVLYALTPHYNISPCLAGVDPHVSKQRTPISILLQVHHHNASLTRRHFPLTHLRTTLLPLLPRLQSLPLSVPLPPIGTVLHHLPARHALIIIPYRQDRRCQPTKLLPSTPSHR